MRKRSTCHPLSERVVTQRVLRDRLKEGIRKVASKPEDPEQRFVVSSHDLSPLLDRTLKLERGRSAKRQFV